MVLNATFNNIADIPWQWVLLVEYQEKITYLSLVTDKGLGAIRAKIGPTSDVDNIFSKMYSQDVLFRNKYS